MTKQAEQEPVAWVSLDLWKSGNYWPDDCFSRRFTNDQIPLYAAPVHTKDLTDDEILAVTLGCTNSISIARAVIQKYRRKNGIV